MSCQKENKAGIDFMDNLQNVHSLTVDNKMTNIVFFKSNQYQARKLHSLQ